MEGNQLDIKVKAARYIDKNNSIAQEFYFAHPDTKVKSTSIMDTGQVHSSGGLVVRNRCNWNQPTTSLSR